jgi:hypothetical protein
MNGGQFFAAQDELTGQARVNKVGAKRAQERRKGSGEEQVASFAC